MKRLAAVLAVICAMTVTFKAQTDFREVDGLELVKAIGIDLENGRTVVTVTASSPRDSKKSTVFSHSGETLAAAVDELERLPLGRELYFGHVRTIVIGEEAARSGIEEIFNYIRREPDMRLDTPVFVAKGTSAAKLISESSREGESETTSLEHIARKPQAPEAGYDFSCRDALVMREKRGAALLMAVELRTEKHGSGPEEHILTPAGYAVISGDKLKAFLSNDAAAGTTVLLNKFGGGTVTVDGGCTLKLKFVRTKICRDRGEITVKIKADSSGNDIEKQERLLKNTVGQWVTAAVSAERELKAGYLNAGDGDFTVKTEAEVKYES